MPPDHHKSEPTPAAAFAATLSDMLGRLRRAHGAAASSDLRPALDLLREASVLRAVLPAPDGCGLGWARGTARPLSDLLRSIGSIDLALARLFEGHVNAALLVEMHGDDPARCAMRGAVRDGTLLGVWGADGASALEWRDLGDGRVGLSGGKRFASGLGVVGRALVTARAGPTAPIRMFLAPSDDAARHDHDDWTASAMRATRSGGFDATGIVLDPHECIGTGGDLTIEPWFEGGTWRYCAAQVGGAEGLIARWTDALRRTDRLGDPVQRNRLGQAMADATAARAVVEAAAEAVEAATDAPSAAVADAVAHALLAREAVEGACIRILALCERSMGMAAQDMDGPVDRMRRDLSLFLRQAAPDAKLDRAVGIAAETGLGGLR